MNYLYIDDVLVAKIEDEVSIGFDAEQLVDLDKAEQSHQIDLEVSAEPSATIIFGGEGCLNIAQRFNAEMHTAEIICDQIVVVSGYALLMGVKRSGYETTYSIRIFRNIGEWIGGCGGEMFNQLPIEYEKYLLLSTIYEGWEETAEESPVKFFPVHRDTYYDSYTASLSEAVIRLRSVDDYHPFINLAEVVKSIVAQDGYTIVSQLFDSEWFGKLYMSGAYSTQDSEVVRSAMGFFVRKEQSSSAEGSSGGRVYLTSSVTVNSVGNLIDIESVENDPECYTYNNCLTVSGGQICFTPTTEVSLGFEFRIRYRTDHTIASRSRLCGYDRFYLYDSNLVELEIPNSYVDHRYSEFTPSHSYLIFVFDHVEDSSYRMIAVLDGGSYMGVIATWSGKSTTLVIPDDYAEGQWSNLILQIYVSGVGYQTTTLDFALYDGYVEESGSTVVDLSVRTPPSTYNPDSPFKLSFPYAESEVGGMSFELLDGSSLSPIFAEYPGYGSKVIFEDVAQHQIRQRVVFESLMHLFNLRVYTDEETKTIYIDPLETLVESGETFDWSGKVDTSQPIEFEDVATEVARERTWGYLREDGYTTRDSEGEDVIFGDWSAEIENYASTDSSVSILNPLFSPSKNSDDDGLLIVGDRDDPLTVDTLEFSPRIVSFEGMESVDNITRPQIYFHSTENNFTLCFEDYDGVEGLNRFYTKQINREQSGQYVTLYLRLTPFDVASLWSPLDGRASLLSNFTFQIDGEWCVCRFQTLESYNVSSSLAKCKFLITN